MQYGTLDNTPKLRPARLPKDDCMVQLLGRHVALWQAEDAAGVEAEGVVRGIHCSVTDPTIVETLAAGGLAMLP